jgi:hypothetical protein
MTDTQTLEILDLLKSLPSEKIDEVKDFAIFLRERYKKNDPIIDENDEWSDEDLQDVAFASTNYFEGAK